MPRKKQASLVSRKRMEAMNAKKKRVERAASVPLSRPVPSMPHTSIPKEDITFWQLDELEDDFTLKLTSSEDEGDSDGDSRRPTYSDGDRSRPTDSDPSRPSTSGGVGLSSIPWVTLGLFQDMPTGTSLIASRPTSGVDGDDSEGDRQRPTYSDGDRSRPTDSDASRPSTSGGVSGASRPTSGVDGDDSESKKSSALLRKQLIAKSSSEEEEILTTNDMVIFPEHVLENMVSLIKCENCSGNGQVRLKRDAFDVDIEINCTVCGNELFVQRATQAKMKEKKTENIGQVTASMVYQSILNGKGLAGLITTCAALGMKPIGNYKFQRYKTYIENLTKIKYEEQNKITVKAIFHFYEETLDIIPDANGILDIDVIFDGTWMTRGHSSKIGVGVLSEAYTGFIIDGEVLSKACHACLHISSQFQKKKMDEVEFERQRAEHEKSAACKKIFAITEGRSSGQMEAVEAVHMWERSLKKNLRYTVFVGDGDSGAYNAVCNLNNKNGPYGLDKPVAKEECVNHVAKRLGSRLRELKKKFREKIATKKGKVMFRSVLGGKEKLTDSVIDKLTSYYGCAIRRGIDHKENAINVMKRDVLATFYHVTSTDEDPNHDLCPDGKKTWCFYKLDLEENKTPRSHKKMRVKMKLPDDLKDPILQIYKDLSTEELLKKCLKGRTQNMNESFNSKIWAKCPKERYHGKDTVENAFRTAALEHNIGYTSSNLSVDIRGGMGSGRKSLKRKDKLRIAASRTKSQTRKKRLKYAHSDSENEDGYKPGAF